MWLVVSITNNDPIVISNLFLNTIKKHQIAPKLLRMDKGNENIYCQDLQVFFTGKEDSYLYMQPRPEIKGLRLSGQDLKDNIF